MDFSQVQCRDQRAMEDRCSERYPVSNSDLFSSSDSSFANEIYDPVYRNLRLKPQNKFPFRMDNLSTDEIPIDTQRHTHFRPQSLITGKTCNRIRTNPRFRPSSFHWYGGKISNERKVFAANYNNDESSEDQMYNEFNPPSYPKSCRRRRRPRYKTHTR